MNGPREQAAIVQTEAERAYIEPIVRTQHARAADQRHDSPARAASDIAAMARGSTPLTHPPGGRVESLQRQARGTGAHGTHTPK